MNLSQNLNQDEHMKGIIATLRRYVDDKIPTGGFLQSVLSNDLTEACVRADDINRYILFDIVKYIYNNLPMNCWGSPEKVQRWLEKEE